MYQTALFAPAHCTRVHATVYYIHTYIYSFVYFGNAVEHAAKEVYAINLTENTFYNTRHSK